MSEGGTARRREERPAIGGQPGRQTALRLVAPCAALLAFPVLIQLALHPVLLGSPLRTWALYWLYTSLGVIAPGTLLLLATLDRRADALTWLGLGWVMGHALELVALLLARQLGHPGLFVLWIPAAYAIALARQSNWDRKLEPLAHPGRMAGGLLLPFVVGATTYFLLNLPEITSSPPQISDVWFHVNNAHEFRDHAPMQDPRLAGETLNYHVHAYAMSAAASLATGEAVLPLLVRYSGMSCVLLLALGLFNVGRAFGGGSAAAGALAALLVVFPIDSVELLLSPDFSFGASLPLFGVHLSTTTLAGYVYLSGLLMLIYWSQRGLRARDHWTLLLLVFAGAGAKAMFGPVVLAGALGVAGWTLLATRRFQRRAWATAGVLAAGILPALLPLLVGEDSYVTSTAWTFAAFARTTRYFETLAPYAPGWLLASFWIFGFALPLLAGAVLAPRLRRGSASDAWFVVFAWACFLASLVPALGIALRGSAQLFFLYYGCAALAVIAGSGLVQLARRLREGRKLLWGLAGLALGYAGLHLAFGLPFSASIANPATNQIWQRTHWLNDAGLSSGVAHAGPALVRLGLFRQRLELSHDTLRGLEWARQNLPKDAVFAVNIANASPYAGYSESRAFLETTIFHVQSHRSDRRHANRYFRPRQKVLRIWRYGHPDLVELLQEAGITHLFVDHAHGMRVEPVGRPVFESPGFDIYELPRSEGGRGPSSGDQRSSWGEVCRSAWRS